MKARTESRVVLLAAVLFGLALVVGMLWVGWRRANFPGPLAVEEEWVLLGVVEPAAHLPFWNGLLVPWIGRLMAALHGPGFVDLRLLSLIATAWSLVLITRIAGHFGGPQAGLVAAGFYAGAYGVGAVRYEVAGGHALALAGVLQAIQLALLGLPRTGLALGLPIAVLAFDLAGPRLGTFAWLEALLMLLPGMLALALVGAIGIAHTRRATVVVVGLCAGALLAGALLEWRSPFLAWLAVCAAVGLRALNLRFATLTPGNLAMRFVLLFLACGQLGGLAVLLAREVPSEAERRNAIEVASVIAELQGEVWSPSRPFTTWLHKKALVTDVSSARALLTDSTLLEVHGAPQDHALPGYPQQQNGGCRKGGEFEQLWWHVRSMETKLLDRIRTSVQR